MVATNDLEGALKRYEAAHEIMGVPTTGIEVARTRAKLGQLVEARAVAIELTIAAQAVDLRGSPRLGDGTRRAYALVRERVPFTDAGETVPADLEPVVDLVRSGALSRTS